MTANGIDVKNWQYFNSNTFPLKVVLNSAEKDDGIIQIIYKVKVLVKTIIMFEDSLVQRRLINCKAGVYILQI